MLQSTMFIIWVRKASSVAKQAVMDNKESVMSNAVQQAKRNDLKSTLKFVFVLLTFAGVLFGVAVGVVAAASLNTATGLWPAWLLFPLVLGSVVLLATVWHYTKKIDQL